MTAPASARRLDPRGASRPTRVALRALALVLGLALLPACAFQERLVMLEEYQANLPARGALEGLTVCVLPFDDTVQIEEQWEDSERMEPPADHAYREFDDSEEDRWDAAVDAAYETQTKADWHVVGWMRNGFGMHTDDVYSINPPAEWLTTTLGMEFENQGAELLPPEQADAADLVVSGTIRYFKVDVYMTEWADLVADVELTYRGAPAGEFRVHGAGSVMAWSTSSFEFFNAIRKAHQVFCALLLERVEMAMASQGAGTASETHQIEAPERRRVAGLVELRQRRAGALQPPGS